jgi:dUTP pyrophosphatase
MAIRYVSFQLMSPEAMMPVKQHDGDAGWDLYCSRPMDIAPGETADVHTDICLNLPARTYLRIVGRSSSLRKYNLLVNEGIIDNGYTGELFVCVHNMGSETFHVEPGMRLAQVLFGTIDDIRWSQADELAPSRDGRGSGGFGSTGR